MENWIKKMNEMFVENCYTNDNRVSIIIINDCTVRIKVLSKSIDIDVNGLSDYGLMLVIMSQVDRLYADDDDDCIVSLNSKYSEYIN